MATGVEVRQVVTEESSVIRSMGIIGGGCELMRYAWPRLAVAFSIRHKGDTIPPSFNDPSLIGVGPHRLKSNLLKENAVDLLIIERGHYCRPTKTPDKEPWERLIAITSLQQRPRIVIESWQPDGQLWKFGPVSKSAWKRWDDLGYNTHSRTIDATFVGGAIQQKRLLVVRLWKNERLQWEWDSLDRNLSVLRPMENLLTPPGLVPRRHFNQQPTEHTPIAQQDPMPNRIGALITTEKGTRRLMKDEFARGLGIPKKDEETLTERCLLRSTSVFHWEYLSYSLQRLQNARPTRRAPTSPILLTEAEATVSNQNTTFDWKPTDISPGGTWYQTRVDNLEAAAAHYPDPPMVILDGLSRLRRHRENYNEDGPSPKWLQLLWWEFPQEHWEELKEGARQNFVQEPTPCIQPNAVMDPDMERAAAAFVDELMTLGVVRNIEEGKTVLTNAPLFVVPKEGQEGQWRVIADMLRGGQNDCVAQDPVYMPRISHIVDEMYTGGYSAIVDLSKFFHNFPTHAADRPYLGLLHPGTKELVTYFGLAMGAGNSPALACKFGAAFVRLLKEKFEVFQGAARANCYWTGFSEIGFDPKLGYGFILEDKDGGSVLVWVWVDDFLIHGPTYDKTAEALTLFLDTAVDCGFLFNPQKLITPSQEVKYCGFIFDTTSVPSIRIPGNKRERALGICEYLLHASPSRAWSRLSLAVAAGILESLTEATPRRLGHTHLRQFHSLVHPPDLGTGAAPYYTTTRLTKSVRTELEWWTSFLKTGKGRFVRASHASTLVPTFGDGSGTGTGGTIQIPGCPFEMWLGKWIPLAYEFASVWKELATLKETLLRIKEGPNATAVRHTTVFYFTDNSGVYWIATTGSSKSPGLHKLIGEIRLLEIELECMLQVVHVPGLVLITQGTDGLSRGVWMTPFHPHMGGQQLNRAIFDPLPFDPSLVWEVFPELTHRDHPWCYVDWNQRWTASLCMGKTTVWFPPPEIAQQLLSFLLNTWVEQASTTSAILFVPRILESNWRNLSRYVTERTVLYPHRQHFHKPPTLPIPIVVLHLATHTLSLSPRLDRTPGPTAPRWHREQAALMRGL